jgi:hypothetical protein
VARGAPARRPAPAPISRERLVLSVLSMVVPLRDAMPPKAQFRAG